MEEKNYKSRGEMVGETLKQEILDLRLKPGQMISENDVCDRFGVSRTPVREALRQIVSDGLADEIPNKGVFVRRLTARDVDELCELRVLIEGYAIRTGYAQCGDAQRAQLESLIKAMEQAHARDDAEQYIQLDSQMHMLFVEQCGNRLIQDMYKRAYWMVQRFRVYSLKSKDRFQKSLAEHQHIVSCILNGDCEGAVQYDKTHLEQAKETIYQFLDRMEDQE